MAYLRILKRNGRRYFYILRSVREGHRIRPKLLEYLGRDPDPKRLKAALKYWKVGTQRKKPSKGGKE
jgi:hypothetical protein